MTTLSSLPPPVLSEIFFGSHSSYLVIALWKCGDRMLNAKLATGIEYLDLKDVRVDTSSRLPKLIGGLRGLRYLALNRGPWSLMERAWHVSLVLQTLSSKLETLSIRCADAEQCFWRHDLDHRDDLGRPKPVETMYALGKSRFFDMSLLYPHLKTLEIVNGSWSRSTIDSCDFPGLPPSLTSLKAPYLYVDDSSLRVCSLLPRKMVYWKANIQLPSFDCPDFWSDAPPMLQHIDSISCKEQSPPFTILPLPPSLTSIGHGSAPVTLELPLLQHTPPLMLEFGVNFSLCSDDAAHFDYTHWKMPSHLTKLSLILKDEFWPLFIRIAPHILPASLTELCLQTDTVYAGLDSSLIENAFWPPNLTTLDLPNCIWPAALRSCLPPKIKKLALLWDEEKVPLDELPRSLTQLTIYQGNDGYLPRSLEGLPPTLEYLSIFGNSPSAIPFVLQLPSSSLCESSDASGASSTSPTFTNSSLTTTSTTFSSSSSSSSTSTPSSITSSSTITSSSSSPSCSTTTSSSTSPTISTLKLDLDPSNIPMDPISRLPSSLTTFLSRCWRVEWNPLLPTTITDLDLCIYPYDDPNSIDGHDVTHYIQSHFSPLPTGTKSLQLQLYGSFAFKMPSLDFMVSNLRHLEKLNIEGLIFEPACLSSLPSSIRELDIHLSHFKDEFAPYLNPKWTAAYLRVDEKHKKTLAKHWHLNTKCEPLNHYIEKRMLAAMRRTRTYPQAPEELDG